MAAACSHQGDVVVFEVNAIGWAPSGARTSLSLHHELDPVKLPAAKGTGAAVGHESTPSGRYVLAAGRTDEEDGLCQAITPGALKPRVTYRVAGWISVAAPGRVGGTATPTHHPVHVSIRVDDGRCVVDGGAVACPAAASDESEAGMSRWAEIKGSFRLKESPRSAAVYVHGAPAGVDVKVMDFRIIATDRKARFSYLKDKTDKVRKRDVVVKLGGAPAGAGWAVRVVQLDSAFPVGSCINGAVIQDPAFVDFFTNHMDWAVLENELKWYWTEAQRGQLNYGDADRLLDFCDRLGKPVRGHCIFWAVDDSVQQWIKDIGGDRDQLMAAVRSRLAGLLGRYAGRFPHYDVNNEMLHGRFFRDRLGDDVAALMFREAARLDPAAALFVNDYNVECGNDPNATPERYAELIRDLQRGGARVGGVGLQGHVTHPVGEVICGALDALSAAASTDGQQLPIWFTELDVCEPDDALRADDLEVVMREAFAHPAVQGVVLWGFMQGHMWRQDAALVNADGTVNDAGQRFVDLRREWTTDARGRLDADGQFSFRGFHGNYVAQVTTPTGNKMLKAFTVDKGETPLVLHMDNELINY